ncbi:MAG: hypothetical protein ACRDZ1_16790 [Acidimicrobiia bacterium]
MATRKLGPEPLTLLDVVKVLRSGKGGEVYRERRHELLEQWQGADVGLARAARRMVLDFEGDPRLRRQAAAEKRAEDVLRRRVEEERERRVEERIREWERRGEGRL